MIPQKNLSRGSLSNWCDADTDTDANPDVDAYVAGYYYVWILWLDIIIMSTGVDIISYT